MKITKTNKGICLAKGFYVNSQKCQIKETAKDKYDLTVIYSSVKANAVGFFTTNEVKSASVLLCQKALKNNRLQAIITNSGNANACNGFEGMKDAVKLQSLTAKNLKLNSLDVAICSTGIIGKKLPMEKIIPQINPLTNELKNNEKASLKNAKAIMTSDTSPKIISYKVKNKKLNFNIGGIAKGAGMINPKMATMLAFIATDINISKELLQKSSKNALAKSFNAINIDGDTSTNDTVIVMANGLAKNKLISKEDKSFKVFQKSLIKIMKGLAKKIVKDGERTSKVIKLNVIGAESKKCAKKVCQAVSNSLLVKCSWAGNDPNWGRVLHAVGYSKAKLKPNNIDISYNDKLVVKNSTQAKNVDLSEIKKLVENKTFTITINLNNGKKFAKTLCADLTEGYVNFNLSEYRLA